VEGLREEHRARIKGMLWKTHGAFWKAADTPNAELQAMKRAFNRVARVLSDAGLLTEQVLTQELPDLIWDSAIAGGWWRLASEAPCRMFREKLGHYWVWRDDSRDWNLLFAPETASWRAKLLQAAAPRPTNKPAKPATAPRAKTWEEVAIVFLSEERVRIEIGEKIETCNYEEMGFADQRNGKPNKSWTILLLLARNHGIIPLNRSLKEWAAIENPEIAVPRTVART